MSESDKKELIGTYRIGGESTEGCSLIVFRPAGTVDDIDVSWMPEKYAQDIVTKLRVLAEESAYRLACIKRLVENHVLHDQKPVGEIIDAWEEARQIIVDGKGQVNK